MSDAYNSLHKLIVNKKTMVGVLGLGYVGLPLSLEIARRGFEVIGFDADETKIRILEQGHSYIKTVSEEEIAAVITKGHLTFSGAFSLLDKPDVLVICLPTPLTALRKPDLSYLNDNVKLIGEKLRRGQLIVLESTTYPGTTRELLESFLKKSDLECGVDFFLAYSPERLDPGNIEYGPSNIPKVVGGVDEASTSLAQAFYNQLVENTIRMSSAEAAEAVKLTENVFRAINIALVNELKIIFDSMGLDIWEIIDAAITKPFGYMRFDPGPGWGGHCIPVDPYYLAWKAREHSLDAKFIELAGEVNFNMPKWIVGKLQMEFNRLGKVLKGSKILLIGVAYKRNVDDTRESPAFVIMDLLEKLGAETLFHDPFVDRIPVTRNYPDLAGRESIELTPQAVEAVDAAIVVTDHDCVDYKMLAGCAKIVLDARGIYHREYPDLKDQVLNV